MIETVGRYRSLKAVVELKGADYVYVGSRAAVADDVARGRLITVAAREEKAAITLKQWIAKTAVNGSRAVSRTTAQRAIDKMVEHGAVVRLPAPKRAGGDRFFFKAGREKF